MKFKIPNVQIQELLSGKRYSYPKYATQIMNLANQNAQGTRPRIVGQMSDLVQEFQGASIEEWEKWYLEKYPDAIDVASDKVWAMIQSFQANIQMIDRDIVKQWVEELVVVKTFSGLKFQQAILKVVAEKYNKEYRLATIQEESQGIDGLIGGIPVSIKPDTYKIKFSLSEMISVPIIFYNKKKSEIVLEFDLPELEI